MAVRGRSAPREARQWYGRARPQRAARGAPV